MSFISAIPAHPCVLNKNMEYAQVRSLNIPSHSVFFLYLYCFQHCRSTHTRHQIYEAR